MKKHIEGLCVMSTDLPLAKSDHMGKAKVSGARKLFYPQGGHGGRSNCKQLVFFTMERLGGVEQVSFP